MKFQTYLSKSEGLPEDWVNTALTVSSQFPFSQISINYFTETIETTYVRLLLQCIS